MPTISIAIFGAAVSHWLQSAMRPSGRQDDDGITRAQHTALQHNRHDARLPHQPARFIAPEHRGHQPRLEMIKLGAGIAEPRDFYNRLSP
jgi:hypothetical protein